MRLSRLALAIALAVPFAAAAQGSMKGMDMKDMDVKSDKKGMEMHQKCMDMKGMEMTKCTEMMNKGGAKPAAARKAGTKAHSAAGTISGIDKVKGTVTLAHEAVPSMNWPAMTMTFKVKDKTILDRAKPGAKVRFSFVQSGKDSVITELKQP